MLFQITLDILVAFIIIWMFFRFILPMFYSEETKQRKLDAKKSALKEQNAEVNNLKEELIVTKQLKTVVSDKKALANELAKEDSELTTITKGTES